MLVLVHLLTQFDRAYKTGNISATVEDRAKLTIIGLYKVVHWLSIAAKMFDLEMTSERDSRSLIPQMLQK